MQIIKSICIIFLGFIVGYIGLVLQSLDPEFATPYVILFISVVLIVTSLFGLSDSIRERLDRKKKITFIFEEFMDQDNIEVLNKVVGVGLDGRDQETIDHFYTEYLERKNINKSSFSIG